jgi:putative ABC transport system permease protein
VLRNKIRTSAVVLVLAVAIGLALSLLVANLAVSDKLDTLRADLDTRITAHPGVAMGGNDGNKGGGPNNKSDQKSAQAANLTADQLAKVKKLDHVASADAFVSGSLTPKDAKDDSDGKAGGPHLELRGDANGANGSTDLKSDLTAQDFGAPAKATGSFPINVTGVEGDRDSFGNKYDITSGRMLKASDDRGAVLSEQMAKHNHLKVGDTFSAYGKTFTVVGIAKTASKFDNVSVVMRAETIQDLGDVDGYTSISATADDPKNVDAVVDDMQDLLGKAVQVESGSGAALDAVNDLETVSEMSWIGFLVALGCAAVVVFFTLTMTVRERRKEVGVLKAIGGTNRGVITQFVAESVTLVVGAAVLGLGVATLAASALTNVLVHSNVGDGGSNGKGGAAGPVLARMGPDGPHRVKTAADLVGNVAASLGPQTLLWGAAVVLAIAIAGSAIPAWLIARVRPAEVLRGE